MVDEIKKVAVVYLLWASERPAHQIISSSDNSEATDVIKLLRDAAFKTRKMENPPFLYHTVMMMPLGTETWYLLTLCEWVLGSTYKFQSVLMRVSNSVPIFTLYVMHLQHI